MAKRLILVTGASGYIGGRLIPLLLDRGYRVRCLVREPASLQGHPWVPRVELAAGDLVTGGALDGALEGVSAAYYLVHNMAYGRRYPPRDMTAAQNFAAAADRAGVERIVYLGGLADPVARIGEHMRSRIQTGEALRQGRVPVTEFRAGVIVGPGSISFEMIRYITEQFPILVGPRWMRNRVQPIDIRDVLEYLVAALEVPASKGRIIEIGGGEVLTYADTMQEFARLRGLKRPLVMLPWMPIDLLACVVDRLTPVPASIARPLIDGMRSDSIVWDDAARQLFPGIRPLGYREAVSQALSRQEPAQIEPNWDEGINGVTILKHAGFFIESRRMSVEASAESAFAALVALGGKHGWLYLDWLWRVRGLLDRLAGGPGMRGRRDPKRIEAGEVLDFYRVEALQMGRLMRLRAELKSPGSGWMEWRLRPLPASGIVLTQTAYFAPKGARGYVYWYLLYPLHHLVFTGLFRRIVQAALRSQEDA